MPQPRAKELRANQTDAERKLWSLLRNKRLAGFRFRRQHPIGPYFADFFCASAKLIVELDGSQHMEEEQTRHDEVRTAWLTARGYRILRFWNNDVLKTPDVVLEAIWDAVSDASAKSSPTP